MLAVPQNESPAGPRHLVNLENIPQVLRDREQWVVWHLGKPDATGKRPKLPLVRESEALLTGSNWPRYPDRWWSFEKAIAILDSGKRCQVRNINTKYRNDHPNEPVRYFPVTSVELAGIGLALRCDVNPPGQILLAFDVDDHSPDHRLQLVKDGRIHNPIARDLVERLNSYCEITPSGHGFRVLCLVPSLPPGIGPGVTDNVKYHNLGVEIFAGNKFITVTGNHAAGTPTDIKLQSIDKVASHLSLESRTVCGSAVKPQRIESNRHNFLKKQAKKLVSGCWISDRELLLSCLMHLRDTWCQLPETVPDREVESIVEWALMRCYPDPLWQGNDSYLASSLLDSDQKYAAGWRGEFTLFDGDFARAYDYVIERLLKSCGNDPDQAGRIYQSSPLYKIVEAQLPDHIKNA